MSIDFSKAPEGATHYSQDHEEFYRDGGNGVLLCFDEDMGE